MHKHADKFMKNGKFSKKLEDALQEAKELKKFYEFQGKV